MMMQSTVLGNTAGTQALTILAALGTSTEQLPHQDGVFCPPRGGVAARIFLSGLPTAGLTPNVPDA